MPELPEVETVRRMLEAHVLGLRIARVTLSGLSLRVPVSPSLPRRARGKAFVAARRRGKYLLLDLEDGLTIVSHLGMSGRWLFHPGEEPAAIPHLHARLRFADGGALWFQDPRRFGLLLIWKTSDLGRLPELAVLGPDPVHEPPAPRELQALARGSRLAMKQFLLDQKKIAGIGNIYASEILFRAGIDPRRVAGALEPVEWERVTRELKSVLGEAIERMGTTFSMYRTLWNEPGSYGDQLLVYDRGGQPCRRCGAPIRRIVQAQRSTFYCARCQRGRPRR